MQAWELIIQVLMALTLHEFAHAAAADRLGDPTADLAGRLTLNPFAHLSLVGTCLVPAMLQLLGLPVIGWCKSVPVDTSNFRDPMIGMAWVAAAGPAMNLALALLWLAITAMTSAPFAALGLAVNVAIALFNFVPCPGFDGWHIARGLWHAANARRVVAIQTT